jgi:hypothetical protein
MTTTNNKYKKDGCHTKQDGTKEWWYKGIKHRLDGPAVIFYTGTTVWWYEGKKHRLEGPCITYYNGNNIWYKNDVRHRDDGPAVENSNGTKRWYLDGELIYDDFENNLHKCKDLSEEFKHSIIKYKLMEHE